MFSIAANSMYSIDENGKHSIEVSYKDSDGIDVGAYAEGDSFEDVINDIVDQVEEGIAEFDDDRADVEESENLKQQIAELQAQIDDLKIRNEELEKRHAEKLNSKPVFDENVKDFLKYLRKDYDDNKKDITTEKNKISDFPFAPKWWV